MATPGAPGQADPSNWDHNIDDEFLNTISQFHGTFPGPLLGIALGLLLSLACGLVGLLVLYGVARIIW